MAFSISSDTKKKFKLGNRFLVVFEADEVDNTGSYVAKADIGLSSIDSVQAAVKESNVAVQVTANSQDGSTLTNYGDVFLKTGSGTHDVYVWAVGR